MLGTHVFQQNLRMFNLKIHTSSKYFTETGLQRLQHFPSLIRSLVPFVVNSFTNQTMVLKIKTKIKILKTRILRRSTPV